MAIIVAILILSIFIYILYRYDYRCYCHKLDLFELKAHEFITMYDILEKEIVNCVENEICFEGNIYNARIFKNDYKNFYLQMNLAICDVLDSYDQIGERYLLSMDNETEKQFYELYNRVIEIESTIRYQSWLKGIK